MRRQRKHRMFAALSTAAFVVGCLAGVVWISSLHAATQAAVSANLRELGLRSAVAQQDLREHQAAQQQQQAAQQQQQAAQVLELDYRQPPVPRLQNRKLDIVMAYTSGQSTQETVRVWRQVLQLPNIRVLSPYIFLYCKDRDTTAAEQFFLALGRPGEVIKLENIGREQHTYLMHLIFHWSDLARHTFFTQALPLHRKGLTIIPGLREIIVRIPWFSYLDEPAKLLHRASLLHPNTGLLAIDRVDHSTCTSRQVGLTRSHWGETLGPLCPPNNASFLVFWKGEFVASRRRLQSRSLQFYTSLLEHISAPDDSLLHQLPGTPRYLRTADNPIFGHVMERAWNLILNCLDDDARRDAALVPKRSPFRPLDGKAKCNRCDKQGVCPIDACQCLDVPPVRT